jgi:hypothetical protein
MSSSQIVDAELKQLIADFRQHIRSYQAALNQQGTWLLLATLGCWSVGIKPLQWFAYLIVLGIFVVRMRAEMGDERSFQTISEAHTQRINSSPVDQDTKKARLWDLKEVQNTELGPKIAIRRNLLFFFCWLFYGFSFLASTPLWKAAA